MNRNKILSKHRKDALTRLHPSSGYFISFAPLAQEEGHREKPMNQEDGGICCTSFIYKSAWGKYYRNVVMRGEKCYNNNGRMTAVAVNRLECRCLICFAAYKPHADILSSANGTCTGITQNGD